MEASKKGIVRYLSIFFEIKDLDRTNPCGIETGSLIRGDGPQAMKSQIAPRQRGSNFRFPDKGGRAVFDGEFDSGSERTLAAWIRHASRARFFPVAIQGKI